MAVKGGQSESTRMIASCLSFLLSPSFVWVWELVDALTIIAVAVGCWGEVWAEHHEFQTDPLDLMPLEFKRGRYKRLFGSVVYIALAIEFCAFGLALLGSH